MNFTDFIASLSFEQSEALKSFVFDNASEADIFMSRARTSHAEAYWHGRLNSFQFLYCHLEPNCFKNPELASEFIETSSETPERWLNDNDNDNDSDSDDEEDDYLDSYNCIHSSYDDNDPESDTVTVKVSYALLCSNEYRCFVKDKSPKKNESYVVFLNDDDKSIGAEAGLTALRFEKPARLLLCLMATQQVYQAPNKQI